MPRKRQSQTGSTGGNPTAIIPPSGNYSIPTLLRELHSLIHQLQVQLMLFVVVIWCTL